MIRTKYQTELNGVFSKLVEMCKCIEVMIENCITALVKKDKALAKDVIKSDKQINRYEREIESECLKILLMEHPVATDFRLVSSALKMITDLERIGDGARDIAELSLQFGDEDYIKQLIHIPLMGKIVSKMVKAGVESYIYSNLDQARSLDRSDDEVDSLFETIKQDLIMLIKQDNKNADQAILFMMIAKYLERIGDHAVNIGEWVDYAMTGTHK